MPSTTAPSIPGQARDGLITFDNDLRFVCAPSRACPGPGVSSGVIRATISPTRPSTSTSKPTKANHCAFRRKPPAPSPNIWSTTEAPCSTGARPRARAREGHERKARSRYSGEDLKRWPDPEAFARGHARTTYNLIIPFTTARIFSRSSAVRRPSVRPERSTETERNW